MQTLQQEVADYYTHGSLEVAILAGLRALGRDVNDIRPEDLAALDEFHIGGQSATDELAAQLDLKPGNLFSIWVLGSAAPPGSTRDSMDAKSRVWT